MPGPLNQPLPSSKGIIQAIKMMSATKLNSGTLKWLSNDLALMCFSSHPIFNSPMILPNNEKTKTPPIIKKPKPTAMINYLRQNSKK